MKFFVKNMYSPEDIVKVKAILQAVNIPFDEDIQPGEITIFPQNTTRILSELKHKLEAALFTLIFDRKKILTEQLKRLLLQMFSGDELPSQNYSIFISRHLNLNYNYVATVFSETEGISVEQFIIRQKIQKAKIHLQSGRFTIGAIAAMLHYSSIGHFSNQFKKLTGKSPSTYKKTEAVLAEV